MIQYYLYSEKGEFVDTNYFEFQPENSTEVPPTVPTKYAVFNGSEWIDARGDKFVEVPSKVSNAQLRLALIQAGIMPSTIDAGIDAIPDGAMKETISTLWNFETDMHRKNATLNAMASTFGISKTQLDGIFILANTL